MSTIRFLVCLAVVAGVMNAQTATQIDVSRVKGAAQLGSDGKVLATQLPASSGSGASQTAQLTDWAFTRVTATQLQFGSACVPATPCNVSIGGRVTQFTDGPYTINLLGTNAAGFVCVYISPTSQLTVGVGSGLSTANVNVPSSLAVVSGVSACPPDSVWLAQWQVSATAFSTTGTQYAAYVSYKPSPLAGPGIQVTAGQRDTIQVDTGSVLRKFVCTSGPGTTLPSGATQGDICWDFAPTTPAKYVCANAGGCTTAAHWKSF